MDLDASFELRGLEAGEEQKGTGATHRHAHDSDIVPRHGG
jgi:hypothetical protein